VRLRKSVYREAKKPDRILKSDKFTFMKNDCADDKWVVIELSQRVRLSSLEITMLELYSSRARTIDIYSTLAKPPKVSKEPWNTGEWEYVATVRAENKKGDHVRFRTTAGGFPAHALDACRRRGAQIPFRMHTLNGADRRSCRC
jgi:hypothetical protein